MGNIRRHLASMNRLVTFEAACRTANFSRAAEHLGITRISVSRQIAELEAMLGVTLFQRNHRTVSLTEAGKQLESSVTPALSAIADTLIQIQERTGRSRVSVTTTTAFATYWLMPRLGRFGALFPEIELNLVVSDRYLDLDAEEIDVAIRYTDDAPEAGRSVALFRERVFPVFSPSYRAKGALSKPGDLLDEDLISLAGPYRPEARWPHWFRRMGVETPGLTPGATMNTYITMVQAAVEGQGIALAGSPLVDTLIETGSLVTLPEEFAIERAVFFLLEREGASSDAAVFYDWLVAQARDHASRPSAPDQVA